MFNQGCIFLYFRLAPKKKVSVSKRITIFTSTVINNLLDNFKIDNPSVEN